MFQHKTSHRSAQQRASGQILLYQDMAWPVALWVVLACRDRCGVLTFLVRSRRAQTSKIRSRPCGGQSGENRGVCVIAR